MKLKTIKNRHILITLIVIFLNSCTEQQIETNHSEKTRYEKWIEDIAFFEHEYLNDSKTFSRDSIASCKTLLKNLKTKINTISDNQVILELSKCVAKANNGHTTIHLSRMDKIPVRFFWFADDLHIIKTDSSSSKYLGSKVLKINTIKVDQLQKRLNPYLSGIESWKKYTASNYLSSPEVLHGIGLSKRDSLTLSLVSGSDTLDVSFGIKKMKNNKYEYETWANLYPDDPKDEAWRHVLSQNGKLPLYLKHMNKGVFYEFVDSEKIAYFSINALWYECPDFKGKINEFLESLKTKTNYNVIIDLRYYTGGNFMLPLKLASKPPRIIDDDKKIYLITSNKTFSAGLVTAARTKYFAKDKVVIVGEKVGDNLKFWAEGIYYTLPNSGIEIQDSKYEHDWKNDKFVLGRTFWVNAIYGVAAKDLNVDKEIKLNFKDYVNKKDPIYDWILKQTN